MAARLLRIKAQMLLPRGDEEQWEDPRAELVRRLLEYQQMREVVDVLERRGEERRNQFARAYLPQAPAAAAGAARALARRAALRGRSRAARGRASRTCTRSIPRALDIPGAITDHSLGARAPGAHPVDGARRARRRTLADSFDAARSCSSSRSSASCAWLSPDLSPTWRSLVTPLAKLLEAALFASARPDRDRGARRPRPGRVARRVAVRARRAARALRRRRPRRRARRDRRRVADPDARRVHRGDRARAARGASGAAVRRGARDARDHRVSPADQPRRDRGDSRRDGRQRAQVAARARAHRRRRARAKGLGRPLLYGTTPVFLEHFALRHLEELPRADELAIALRVRSRRRARAGRARPTRANDVRDDAHPARAGARRSRVATQGRGADRRRTRARERRGRAHRADRRSVARRRSSSTASRSRRRAAPSGSCSTSRRA